MKTILAVALASMTVASGSGAATLNFIAEADGNERGVVNGTTIDFDGVNVTFSSSHFAYFDEGAGLGVCKNLAEIGGVDNQCSPSVDDNVTVGESATIAFDALMDLSDLSFQADGHIPLDSEQTLLFGVNGGPLTQYSFASLGAESFSNVMSATFAFGGTKAEQFYVSSAVATASPIPLPAAAPLLLAGLGSLAFWARRRRSAA